MRRLHLFGNALVRLLGALPNNLTVSHELVRPIITFGLFINCHFHFPPSFFPLGFLGLPFGYPPPNVFLALLALLKCSGPCNSRVRLPPFFPIMLAAWLTRESREMPKAWHLTSSGSKFLRSSGGWGVESQRGIKCPYSSHAVGQRGQPRPLTGDLDPCPPHSRPSPLTGMGCLSEAAPADANGFILTSAK